jgi:hypothetical protein
LSANLITSPSLVSLNDRRSLSISINMAQDTAKFAKLEEGIAKLG